MFGMEAFFHLCVVRKIRLSPKIVVFSCGTSKISQQQADRIVNKLIRGRYNTAPTGMMVHRAWTYVVVYYTSVHRNALIPLLQFIVYLL